MSLIRSLIRVGVVFKVLTSAAVLLVKHLMKRNSHTHRPHDAAKRSENSKQETSISKYEADTEARERSDEKYQAREEKYWIFSIIISLGALGGAAYGVVVAKDALTASQQQASAALGQLVETRAQERAWIDILGGVIARVPVVGSELKIVFDYQNYGHAPARDLTITRDVRNFSGMRPSDITPSFILSDIEACKQQPVVQSGYVVFPDEAPPPKYNIVVHKEGIDANIITGRNDLIVFICVSYTEYGSTIGHTALCSYYDAALMS